MDCDASDFGIGGVLSQVITLGVEQPISYFIRTLSKPERNYAVTRKEMLALFYTLRHFHRNILGKKLKVCTDHRALQLLRTCTKQVCQVASWIKRLAEYEFDIEHRPGKQHANVDARFRYPASVSTVSLVEM